MGKLRVAFLWHLHQPLYRDADGRQHFPWVYLYGLKDYGAMPRLAREAGVRVTFNLVPCLMEQLEDYRAERIRDPYWALLSREPTEFSRGERHFLRRACFTANYERIIAPSARYRELWERRDGVLTDDELRDLVVLFHLAWLSPLYREAAHIHALWEQGRDYTPEQRDILRRHCREILGGTEEELRQAQAAGCALSASPYYHPILPLLCGTGEVPFRYPEDAREQILRGWAAHRRRFGAAPGGMWPPEGALSPAAAQVAQEAGVGWVATDEGMLHRALGEERREEGFGGEHLYRQPYRYRGLRVFFRDRVLSDLIGFSYHAWPPETAADDLVHRLEHIADRLGGGEGLVLVALDGENPWEFYPDNGVPFLRRLYQRLTDHPRLTTATLDEVTGESDRVLPRMPTGSWAGDLSTWIGHAEKTRAWEYLLECRRDLGGAQESLLAAEGSDWFWWLGDDHYTPEKAEFEALFRRHLSDAYRQAGRGAPEFLLTPVAGGPRWAGPAPRLFELWPQVMAGGGALRRLWLQRPATGELRLLLETAPSLAELAAAGVRVEVAAAGEGEYRRELTAGEAGGEFQLPPGNWIALTLTARWPDGKEETHRVRL